MAKLSVNLVVYNGAKYIPYLLASLKRQTFTDWELLVVDNASTDNTAELIKAELAGSNIACRFILNKTNLGFSGGHNQAFQATRAPVFLLQNVDMYLMPNVLEKMVNFLDTHPDTAAVAPRLMRWNFERTEAASRNGASVLAAPEAGFTSSIDAVGIRLFKNRRAVEWLTKFEWASDSESKEVREMYAKPVKEVFAVSGAFVVYRKSIIDQVVFANGEMFDSTYHSYKEDLDVGYRLRNAGYVSYVLLDTVAYHDRTGAGPKMMSDWAAIKNKRLQSDYVLFHSYKNHLRTIYKNEYWQNILLDLPAIVWYEFKKAIYILFTKPRLFFKAWYEIIKNFGYTKAARRAILKTRRMHWRGIRRWF